MSQVNLQLLAKELGLSISTVSKALRDSHEISADTKKTVRELAQKLRYTPNPYASSLRRKKSNTIAVVIPEVADSFFSMAIKGIEEVAQLQGYHVLIYLTYEQYQKEKKILEDCKNGRVDGILMSAASQTNTTQHIEELQQANIPIVFFDRALGSLQITRVVTDDYDSSFKATLHLLASGCKNIAYLSSSNSAIMDMNNQRICGFKNALETAGKAGNESGIIHCPDNFEQAIAVIENTLGSPGRPDGLIASVEQLAPAVYLTCKKLGLSIPSSVKVVCFSTTLYASILNPALTTITQPAKEIGKVAVSRLFSLLKDKQNNQQYETIILPSILHIRESSI